MHTVPAHSDAEKQI